MRCDNDAEFGKIKKFKRRLQLRVLNFHFGSKRTHRNELQRNAQQ